jgi:hypothetical protein
MEAVSVRSDRRSFKNKSKSSVKFSPGALNSPSSSRNASKLEAGPSVLRAVLLGETSDNVVPSIEFNPFQMDRARVAEYNSMNALLENESVKVEALPESVSDTLPIDKSQPPSF